MILNIVILFEVSLELLDVDSLRVPHAPIPFLNSYNFDSFSRKELGHILSLGSETVDDNILILQSIIQIISLPSFCETLILK